MNQHSVITYIIKCKVNIHNAHSHFTGRNSEVFIYMIRNIKIVMFLFSRLEAIEKFLLRIWTLLCSNLVRIWNLYCFILCLIIVSLCLRPNIDSVILIWTITMYIIFIHVTSSRSSAKINHKIYISRKVTLLNAVFMKPKCPYHSIRQRTIFW